MTVVQQINDLIDRVKDERASADSGSAREFSIVITHLEDASMRFNRGMAMKNGHFTQADIEGRLAEEAADVLREAENQIHPDQLSLLESAGDLPDAA